MRRRKSSDLGVCCSVHRTRTSARINSIILAVVALLVASLQTAAAQSNIAIIRPNADPPYAEVFDSIVEGIITNSGGLIVTEIVLDTNATAAQLAAQLQSADIDIVITLGRQADTLYRSSAFNRPQLIGALNLSREERIGAAGVSLTPDPRFLFAEVKKISPRTKRIIVVFDPKKDRWIIERARQISNSFSFDIEYHEANDLAAASTHYWNILKYGNPETDAIWLLGNPDLVGSDNLPRIIEESWRRRFIVVSNNLEHANRGVLLASYPDLNDTGRQLADMARESQNNTAIRNSIEFAQSAKIAINLRIASHLGINISTQEARNYDLVFGER